MNITDERPLRHEKGFNEPLASLSLNREMEQNIEKLRAQKKIRSDFENANRKQRELENFNRKFAKYFLIVVAFFTVIYVVKYFWVML